MIDFISNIFISDAFAQTAATPAASGSSLTSFIPLILIFLVFYFLLIRPQQKKAKEHQNTLESLKKGDKIFTNGGIYGTIHSIDNKENLIHLEISDDVIVKIQKHSIAQIVKSKEKSKALTKEKAKSKTKSKKQ